MIAVDTNVLVYAHRRESNFHGRAFDCLKSLAEGAQPWGIPVSCLHEFLAITTNPKIFNPPSSFEQALTQIEAWLAAPSLQILHSGVAHWEILAELTRKTHIKGGQFHDARIAVICIENGVSVLWSADRDFGRFKALKTLNPLV